MGYNTAGDPEDIVDNSSPTVFSTGLELPLVDTTIAPTEGIRFGIDTITGKIVKANGSVWLSELNQAMAYADAVGATINTQTGNAIQTTNPADSPTIKAFNVQGGVGVYTNFLSGPGVPVEFNDLPATTGGDEISKKNYQLRLVGAYWQKYEVKVSLASVVQKADLIRELVTGKHQLFDKNTFVDNQSINITTGALTTISGWRSAIIQKPASSTSVSISGFPIAGGGRAYRFEDSSGAIIAGAFAAFVSTTTVLSWPVGATQLRFTYKRAVDASNIGDTIMVNDGDPLPFETYSGNEQAISTIDTSKVKASYISDSPKTISGLKVLTSTDLVLHKNNVYRSKNLFNKAAGTDGFYIQGVSNEKIADPSYGYSDFIPVTPGQTYTGRGSSNGMRYVAYYDANKIFKQGGLMVSTITFTVPAGVYYVILTYSFADKNTFQFEQAAAATNYVAFSAPIDVIDNINGSTLKAERVSDDLKSITDRPVLFSDQMVVQSTFIPGSKNLFDKSAATDGFFIDGAGGGIVTNATYGYSDFIPVLASLIYTGKGSTNSMRHVAFYNSSKVFVSGGYNSLTTTFTTPASGVSFVRISYFVADKDSFQFEQADVSTNYVPFVASQNILKSLNGATVQASTADVLTIQQSDKILSTGCSYEESLYSLRGKSWTGKLSAFTDWNIANYGRAGDRLEDVVQRLRTGVVRYGVSPAAYNATYITLANNGNETFPNSGVNLDLYIEQHRIGLEVVKAMGATPIIGTDYHVNGNQFLESQLKQLAEKNGVPYMGIGLTGEKILSHDYGGFWNTSHPGTRTNSFIWNEWLYFINQMGRPRKGVKVFRARNTGSTLSELNYDTIEQRFERFMELNVGETSLSEAGVSETYYDRIDQSGYSSQTNNNEYMALINGTNVSFTNYALIELIFDRIKMSSTTVKIKGDSGISFYLKSNNDSASYESSLADTELVFQVTESLYNAFTDTVGTLFTSAGVTAGTVQFAFTGKLKNYAMGKGWFLCFSAPVAVSQANRIEATTVITRVTGGTNVATIKQMILFRYGYSYFANMHKPKGAWKTLTTTYANGEHTLTLPTSALEYFQFDKLKVMAVKSGSFNISGISAAYDGGISKGNTIKSIEQKAFGAELIATRGFDTDWTTTGGWTANSNTLVSMPVGSRDYPPFIARTNHVELTLDSSGFPNKLRRTITLATSGTNRRGFQKVIIRVVARLFPLIYNPDGVGPYFTNAPVITKASMDLGMLCIGFGLTTGTDPGIVLRKPVDIGWSEVTFETTLPIMGASTFYLDVWRDSEIYQQSAAYPMQVFDVSCQIVG